MYFGKHTLHDCYTLASSVQNTLAALRPQSTDVFEAERLAGQVRVLYTRFRGAVEAIQKIKALKGGAEVTPCEALYVRLLRISNDARALEPRFGFDVLSPWDSVKAYLGTTPSLRDGWLLVKNYGPWIRNLGDDFDALQAAWTAQDIDAVQAFDVGLTDLRQSFEQAANLLGQTQGVTFAPAFEKWADTADVALAGPGLDTTAGSGAYDVLLGAIGKFAPLRDKLALAHRTLGVTSTVPWAGVSQQNAPTGADALYSTLTTGTVGALGDIGEKIVTGRVADGGGWWTDPLKSPWIVGGLTVAAVGVVGYTLAQIKGAKG